MSLAGASSTDANLILQLLEARCWTPYHGSLRPAALTHAPVLNPPTADSGEPDANQVYLEQEVFPALVPALHELLRLREEEIELQQRGQEVPVPIRDPSLPVHGPTGQTHPIEWLAQWLLRHNPRHTSKLARHPYTILRHEHAKQS